MSESTIGIRVHNYTPHDRLIELMTIEIEDWYAARPDADALHVSERVADGTSQAVYPLHALTMFAEYPEAFDRGMSFANGNGFDFAWAESEHMDIPCVIAGFYLQCVAYEIAERLEMAQHQIAQERG